MDAIAVYVYHGSPSDLSSAVHKAIDNMKLITKNENVNSNSFSLEASYKLGLITTLWPGKFIINSAFANGISTLTVTAKMNLILGSQAQGLANQAKLTEFIDLVKSFAPNPAPANSGLNDLEKLADLRDKGIITPTEFEAKKKQILGL
jgi:hypothetical protein